MDWTGDDISGRDRPQQDQTWVENWPLVAPSSLSCNGTEVTASTERFYSGMKTQPPGIDRAPSARKNYTRLLQWLPEILSQIGGLLCLLGIVILLWRADGKPPPNLNLGLTLNTILAFLTSMAKVAFLIPIVEGLGQLKWIWFLSRKNRPLVDFQLFDEAAQGGIGGLKLLLSFKGFRASLGALVMLSGLFTSTLTQQAISYTIIQSVSPDGNGTATVNRATTFSTYDGQQLAISRFTPDIAGPSELCPRQKDMLSPHPSTL